MDASFRLACASGVAFTNVRLVFLLSSRLLPGPSTVIFLCPPATPLQLPTDHHPRPSHASPHGGPVARSLFSPPASPSRWLLTPARHECVRLLRLARPTATPRDVRERCTLQSLRSPRGEPLAAAPAAQQLLRSSSAQREPDTPWSVAPSQEQVPAPAPTEVLSTTRESRSHSARSQHWFHVPAPLDESPVRSSNQVWAVGGHCPTWKHPAPTCLGRDQRSRKRCCMMNAPRASLKNQAPKSAGECSTQPSRDTPGSTARAPRPPVRNPRGRLQYWGSVHQDECRQPLLVRVTARRYEST